MKKLIKKVVKKVKEVKTGMVLDENEGIVDSGGASIIKKPINPHEE